MNFTEVLQKAAGAVAFKLTESKNNLKTANELENEYLESFWQREILECEAVYSGLVDMISELQLNEDSK